MTNVLPQSGQAPTGLALVITTLEPGGAELCLTNLALGLCQRRFDPAVYVLGKRPTGNKTEFVDRLDSAGIRTHGIEELLGQQFEPQVFSFQDNASLLQCLTRILECPGLAQRLGKENRRRVVRNFSVANMLSCYERLYREIISRR